MNVRMKHVFQNSLAASLVLLGSIPLRASIIGPPDLK